MTNALSTIVIVLIFVKLLNYGGLGGVLSSISIQIIIFEFINTIFTKKTNPYAVNQLR